MNITYVPTPPPETPFVTPTPEVTEVLVQTGASLSLFPTWVAVGILGLGVLLTIASNRTPRT